MMYDPEKGGMGFYRVIDTSFGKSFYILEKRPDIVEIVDDSFNCIKVDKDSLVDELLSLAEELDRRSW